MKKIVCNYNVIRFLPYPETQEFVNIGILAYCPQIGWMDYLLEIRKTKRIKMFFPELDIDIFNAGKQNFTQEMNRLVYEHKDIDTRQWVLPVHQKYITGIFTEIIRPREEIFRFGEPATLLTDDPEKDLYNLFNHYVERNFTKQKDYQEKIMNNHLAKMFKAKDLLNRYHNIKIGTEDYHVSIPFVEQKDDDPRPLRALKPLNLNQNEATKIRDHGDGWCNKVKRLNNMGLLPYKMLFAVEHPPEHDTKRGEAATEICEMLVEQGVQVENFADEEKLTNFATQTE